MMGITFMKLPSLMSFLQGGYRSEKNSWFAMYFGMDLRLLGLIRILIGVSILSQLIILLPQAEAFYSSRGVLPALEIPRSLHRLYGNYKWILLVFGVHALVSLAFTVGYRTRLTGILTWGLTVSLYQANPFIQHLADNLLVLLLFWSLFTPLGTRFSLDNKFSREPRERPPHFCNIGTMALVLQTPLVYFFAGINKFQITHWWPDLTATYYVFQPKVLTNLGLMVLKALPGWSHYLLTGFALFLELVGPLLVFFQLCFS